MDRLICWVVVCWLTVSTNVLSQTTVLSLDSGNAHKISQLTPPPERYLPTLYLLQDREVQASLSIDDKQRTRIQSISAELRNPDLLADFESTAPALYEYAQLTDLQQRRQLEVRTARLMHLGRRLEQEVLSEEQFVRLTQIRIRLCGMVYFLNEQSDKELSISPDQRTMIFERHSHILRESFALSTRCRDELNGQTKEKQSETNKLLNSSIGDLERLGVEEILKRLTESQRSKYESVAGPPTELHRESLVMKLSAPKRQ